MGGTLIAIPAVDLREGACVQLVGGSYRRERVRLEDPLQAVRHWSRLGFRRLHLVDLDAATQRGSNAAVVDAVLALSGTLGVAVQVGGGVRDLETIERLLAAGASRVVVGTRGLEDPAWLETMSARHPGRLILAADVSGRRVATRGWRHLLARDVVEVVAAADRLPLAGLLVTAVHREGRLAGPDLRLMEAVVRATRLPVIAAGGIATLEHLRSLAARRIEAAVVGMALYIGTLDARATREEFAI
jgi:phosphoribosylformimino-5-aminoimidazole carboxamide ribotide isomerase